MKPKCVRALLTAFLFISLPAYLYAQAGNDNCASATTLTPSSTCTTTSGDLYKATNAAPTGACGGATSTTTYDVWYKFTANATSQSITVNNLGNKLSTTTTYVEVLSGSCGSFTSLACQNVATTLTVSGLTVSTVYYLRVYVTSNPNSNPSSQWGFDICIQGPPANDDCAGAVSLTPATSCSNTSTTLNLATATTGLPAGCESGGTHYDVWYKFVAASTYELISISSLGTNFTNPELQLYSGSCGSLTSVQCGTTSITATGLTIGNTYYVRVSNVGSSVASNGSFNICVYHPASATYDYGKSYVDITRGTGGGTINPGDTLEIRGTLVVRSQSLDSVAFFDTLYHNAGTRLVPGSIILRTNEGKAYKSFTDASGDDAGYRYTNGSDTVIRINMGTGASSSARGNIANTSKPSVFGSTCIIMATYRVVVYAAYGSTVSVGGGAITIKDATTGISSNLNFSSRSAYVYSSPGLCPNAVSATNAIGGDYNGTFGTPSGSAPLARNRGTSTNVPSYIYKVFSSAGGPNDYYYGIANNTSATYSTTTTWGKGSDAHRVFNVWDITGDHTGASNTAKGNPPCDTTKPVSATNPCGYMLVINSAYKTDTAFQYSVTNLCPNTYYEISTWLKNICYKCGCDSNGVGASSAGYIPFATNDSSGVQPNLAFDINGKDYYTTGNLPYLGIYPATQTGSDSTNTWVKRGFTYLTGTSQTSLTLSIRNNAPGGGGNDWAMDDVAFTTCTPSMTFTPTANPIACQGTLLAISCTVTTYFNNYQYFKWQKSTDGGSTWNDASTLDSATLVWNGSTWQFTSNYPPFIATQADSASRYRLVVATTVANLSNSNCLYTDQTNVIYITVYDCSTPLNTRLISFSGKLNKDLAKLNWTTTKEEEPLYYDVERSYDGRNFSVVATVNSYRDYASGLNYYSLDLPWGNVDKAYYRIKMRNNDNNILYSSIVRLSQSTEALMFGSIINPFSYQLNFEIVSDKNQSAEAELINIYGMTMRKTGFDLSTGNNNLSFTNTNDLPAGTYILRVKTNEGSIQKTVIKQNR